MLDRVPENRHAIATFSPDEMPSLPANLGDDTMTDRDYDEKLEELDRLLNDPDVPMEPSKVWSLLAEISHRDMAGEVARSVTSG